MNLALVIRIVTELILFVSVRGFEFVKYWWHQGHRDGRKRLPPIKQAFLTQSATELASKIRVGELKSVDLVKACIERIRETEKYLNAVVDERFDAAMEEALKADEEVAKCQDLKKLAEVKPFLGVPVTTKNCVGIEGLLADNGNIEMKGLRAPEDAECISRMRKAGAIPMAISNVPEMCMWIESHNRLHGRTNNPYDLHRTVGGSTGGEGALIASGGSVIGIGTDLGGSIRTPSQYCGIYGHKPTPLIISRKGLIPNNLQDIKAQISVLGPMARSVCDLKAMMKVITDEPSILRLDEKVDTSKLRYFSNRDEGAMFLSAVDPEFSLQVDMAASILSKETGQVVGKLPRAQELYKNIGYYISTYINLGFPPMANGYVKDQPVEPLTDFFKFLAGTSDRPLYSIYISAMDKRNRKNTERLTKLFEEFQDFKKSLEELLGEDGVLILPAGITPAPFHHGAFCNPMQVTFMGLINALKFPSTVIPTGLSHKGLPLSVQIIANHNQDRLTLAVAELLDNHFGGYKPPCQVISL